MSSPKQKRAPVKSALQSADQLAGYLISCVLQAPRRMIRHCVAYGVQLFGFVNEISLSPKKREPAPRRNGLATKPSQNSKQENYHDSINRRIDARL